MKKKIMAVLLVLCMIFSLTGCMEVSMSVKIARDGSVTSDINAYLNRQEYYNWIQRMEGTGSVSIEEIDKAMAKEGYQVQSINGVDYYVDSLSTQHEISSIAESAREDRQVSVHGENQMWETGLTLDLNQLEKELGTALSENNDYSKKEKKELKKLMDSSYFVISAEFDYDIAETDPLAVKDEANPKKVTWKISFSNLKGSIYARCHSQIAVSGVTQGASYKNPVTLHYEGAVTAVSDGRSVANDETFGTHGQHTVILTSASGEQRTLTFFIDKKKPVIKKIKNKKTYKKGKYFKVVDKDSGTAKVTVNGKKAKEILSDGTYVLNKKGRNRIVVKDAVGNVSRMTVKVK